MTTFCLFQSSVFEKFPFCNYNNNILAPNHEHHNMRVSTRTNPRSLVQAFIAINIARCPHSHMHYMHHTVIGFPAREEKIVPQNNGRVDAAANDAGSVAVRIWPKPTTTTTTRDKGRTSPYERSRSACELKKKVK